MIISFLPKALGILFCAGLIFMEPSCQQDSYRVKLSGPVAVGDQWVELSPESPLKAEKTFQWIVLDLEPPLRGDLYNDGKGPNKGAGILMPNGEIVNPEIEVIDQYGNRFNLVWRGGFGFEPGYRLPHPGEFPRDRQYKAVRIRSSVPIKCKAIYWFCDSSKDWK